MTATSSSNYNGSQECEGCGIIAATKTVGEGEYCRECNEHVGDVIDLGEYAVYRDDNWGLGVKRVLLTWDCVIIGHHVTPRDECTVTDDKIQHVSGWWAKPFVRR